ncbi:ATP-binding protein [Patulibacter americanus]|uniref:ATP-binding protein n=1 Tax=Patulibacter americanus TaxID=588672 RepID=UPI0003B713ED|nr:ATP-binding protein [Patulibacter americanus]
MTRGLGRRIGLVSVAAAALVAVIVAALALGVVALRDAGRASAAAERDIALANRIQRVVTDLETGERGFLVSGDERLLGPFNEARRVLPGLLAQAAGAADGRAEGWQVAAVTAAIREYESRWAVPVVELARRDLPAARRRIGAGDALDAVERLRGAYTVFVRGQQADADRTRKRADRAGRRAIAAGVVGAIACGLLVLGFGASLVRSVVRPARALADAVDRVTGGDLRATVPERSADEVGDLERDLNVMVRALRERRGTHEAQLAAIDAQRDDLESTVAALEDEKAWVSALHRFVERLVAASGLPDLAGVVVEEIVHDLGGDAAVLWVGHGGATPRQVGLTGAVASAVPESVEPGAGAVGRVMADGEPVVAGRADARLAVDGLGGPVRVRHELAIPLRQGDEVLGVVAVGRLADHPFSAADVARGRRLGEQAAVALARTIEERRVARLAGINAAVLEASNFGVVLFGPDQQVVTANRRLRELWEDLRIPLGGAMEDRITRVLELAVDRGTAEAQIAGATAVSDARAEIDLHDPDDGRWFTSRTDPVFSPTEEPLGWLTTWRETTEEHELERVRDEFVATVTHELRTPLSSVVAATDLLEDETEEPTAGQRHWTGMIRRNVDRLLRLVDDLLTVARAESGRFTVQPREEDLATIAADAAQSAQAAASAKDVEVRAEVQPSPVRVDATRMAQAVDNLLANAVKFTPPGGLVRIRVAPRPEDATVVLEVADSGIGIPEEDREHLFERFYRAPAATEGAIPGTGLGLTITKAIVDAHGGSVRVADGIDGGTAFVVVLPAGGPTQTPAD